MPRTMRPFSTRPILTALLLTISALGIGCLFALGDKAEAAGAVYAGGLTPTATPCPPHTITGSITFDDPIRDGTLELDGVASTCAAPKTCPPEVDGRYNYDAYTYVNTTGATLCISVTLDGLGCGAGLQAGVFGSAYLGSFDPNNPCTNYLADVGQRVGPLDPPTTFSFSVPAGATYVIVVEEFTEAFGCPSYTMEVAGGQCATPQPSPSPSPTICAPTVVQGAIDDGDPFTVASLDFTGTSNCGAPKSCPGPVDGDRRYDTHTYVNTTSSPICVNVTVDGTQCGSSFEGVFSAAYLGSFDPNNVCLNYLADPGMYSDPAFGTVSYGFTVPPGATFVIMVQEVFNPVGCEDYRLTITGLPTCLATATPAPPTATVPSTPAATNTPPPGATATATACTVQFSDVPASNPFYGFIRCLVCRQVVSGYSDGTFRPNADVTRGQLSKILASAAGLSNAIPSTQQTFADTPTNNPFWLWIERLAGIGAISGYTCGGPGEPCDGQNRPYFRWGANATRGQISKITGVTAGYNGPVPTSRQTFTDVPSTNPFWLWIEELAARQIINGYTCGGPGEPCDPQNRPYFRWGANTTRGQLGKVAAQTFYPNCQTPGR